MNILLGIKKKLLELLNSNGGGFIYAKNNVNNKFSNCAVKMGLLLIADRKMFHNEYFQYSYMCGSVCVCVLGFSLAYKKIDTSFYIVAWYLRIMSST